MTRDPKSRLSGLQSFVRLDSILNNNGWSDETSSLRLFTPTRHRRTGAECSGMSLSSYILLRLIFDVLTGWKRKPLHPSPALASISQDPRVSQKATSIRPNG